MNKSKVEVVVVYQEGQEDNPHQDKRDEQGTQLMPPFDSQKREINAQPQRNRQIAHQRSNQKELKKGSQREGGGDSKKISNYFAPEIREDPKDDPAQPKNEDEDEPNLVVVYEAEHPKAEMKKKAPEGNLFIVEEEKSENDVPKRRRRDEDQQNEGSSVNVYVPEGQPGQPEEQEEHKKIEFSVNRIAGIIILVLLGCLFWVFGFGSEYRYVTATSDPVNLTTQSLYIYLLIFTAMFAILGFGMLFMYFKKITESAIFISIFIVSITLLLSPIFQKFWYNVFLNGFGDIYNSNQGHDFFLNQALGGNLVFMDLFNMKLSITCAISQLVVLLAVFGRMNCIQLIIFTISYNFVWAFNQFAVLKVHSHSTDPRFYDDYQISTSYLFAACFGLFAFLFLKKAPIDDSSEHNDFSAVFACLGAFMIFFTFPATTSLFSMKTSPPRSVRNYVWMQAFISSYFSLSANIVTTTALTIFMREKLLIRWLVFSVLNGGIVFGCVAEINMNIGASIACGVGSGIITVLFFTKLYPIINKTYIADSYGIFLILIISLISTLLIAPYVLRLYYSNGILLTPLTSTTFPNGQPVPSQSVALWSLAYPGVSILIGSAFGALICFLLSFLNDIDTKEDMIMTDKMYFETNHGLRVQKEKKSKKKKKRISTIPVESKNQSSERIQLGESNKRQTNQQKPNDSEEKLIQNDEKPIYNEERPKQKQQIRNEPTLGFEISLTSSIKKKDTSKI